MGRKEGSKPCTHLDENDDAVVDVDGAVEMTLDDASGPHYQYRRRMSEQGYLL